MAKPRALGTDVEIRGVTEAVYGTAPGTGYTRLVARAIDLDTERPLGVDELIGQGRKAQGAYYERASVTGSADIPVDVRAIGFWLHGLFGAATVTDNGDGTWDHAWSDALLQLPSKAIEIGHPQLTSPKFFRYTGCKFGSLSVPFSGTGQANASVQIIGQDRAEAATSVAASPATHDLRVFAQARGAISVGGSAVAFVTAGQLAFTNTLEAVETIRADGLIEGVDEGNPRPSGSMTVRFSDAASHEALRAAIAAETPVALTYAFTDPAGWSLTFTLPRVLLPAARAPIQGPGGISQTFDWQGEYDSSAGHALSVTLVNDVASYA